MNRSKHLLDLDDADKQFIEALITRARQYKSGVPNENMRLRGRVVLGMFFEPSTRTTTSFAVATQRLGGAYINLGAEGSSLTKGESLEDTMRTAQAIGVDAIVVRHPESGFPHALARHFDGAVLNAGDGAHAHPTQGLLDVMTLIEEFGDLKGRRLTICGDIRHSRVARSSARAAWLLGAAVTLCGPPSLLPPHAPGWGFAELATDIDRVLVSSDALMLLRVQKERAEGDDLPPYDDLARFYGLTHQRLDLLPAHAIVMHPGPVNRDVEIEGALMRHARSRIERQVENGVYVRMAVLERTLGALTRDRVA